MLNITEQRKLIPLLEDMCEKKHGDPLCAYLSANVYMGLEILYREAGEDVTGLPYDENGYNYRAIADELSDYLRCYEEDNRRLASSFHVSEIKPGVCWRKLAYPLLGHQPQKEFSAYATLTALVGDWLHQALQELMLSIDYIVSVRSENGKPPLTRGIELDLKTAPIGDEARAEIERLMIGCRVDMELDMTDDWMNDEGVCGDIKTNSSSKWAEPNKHKFTLDGYGWQVVLGGHFTQSDYGLILEVCRETFQLREHRVEYDRQADEGKRILLRQAREAADSVRRGELPPASPGKGYSKCWGCGYAKVCDDPGRLEFIN